MTIDSKIYVVRHKRRKDETRSEYHNMQRKIAKDILRCELMKYGIDYDNEEILKNIYGKPYLKGHRDIHYNISHCNGAVAVYISDNENGIDIEDIRMFTMKVVDRICAFNEKKYMESNSYSNESFFRIWTLKEAYIKAVGMGLAYSLQNVSFEIGDDKAKIVSANKYNAVVGQMKLTGGYILSYCNLDSKNDMPKIEVIEM